MTEPHERGAVLVSAVFAAFLTIYASRCADLDSTGDNGSEMCRAARSRVDLANRLAQAKHRRRPIMYLICASARSIIVLRSTSNLATTCLRMLPADYASRPRRQSRLPSGVHRSAFRRAGSFPTKFGIWPSDSLLWEPPPMDEKLMERFEKSFLC